jgi:hypothetical protein
VVAISGARRRRADQARGGYRALCLPPAPDMITAQLVVRLHPGYPVMNGEVRCNPLQDQALCYNPASERETRLANLSGIVNQLSKERDRLHRQLSGLNAALEAFAGVYRGNNGIKTRRKISAKGRASIAAAQRARWAKAKGIAEVPKKRTMSASRLGAKSQRLNG